MGGYDPLTLIGFFATVLGVVVTAGAWIGGWLFGRATNRLIVGTNQLIAETASQTHAILERMDQRADERHRDTVEAIRTLRA